jgi:probable rRNA maturation factor
MQALDIEIEDPRWQQVGLPALATSAAHATLQHLDLPADICEISLLACDDTRITALNADFREKPTATNVLSWPAEARAPVQQGGRPPRPTPGPDGLIALGDIAISYDTCTAEATAAGIKMAAHVTHLIVHGVLHLLGYDHVNEADGDQMETIEVEILGKLGYDDPYSHNAANGAATTRSQD